MSAEMHCHTLFSVDGCGTPEELVDLAAAQGITALAVTEHNHLGSLKRARDRARVHGMLWMPGVEIDARFQGHKVHLLAFRFDPENHALRDLLNRNHARYSRQYELLLEYLPENFRRPSREELVRLLDERYPTHPDPSPSSSSLRALLQEQLPGMDPAPDLKAMVRRIEADKGPNGYDRLEPFESVRSAVHGAGGVLLLAHVAKVLAGQAEAQEKLINAALEAGADGFELWHPRNMAEPHFKRLESAARCLGCLVSGGSDCHSAATTAGPKVLGSVRVPVEAMEKIVQP